MFEFDEESDTDITRNTETPSSEVVQQEEQPKKVSKGEKKRLEKERKRLLRERETIEEEREEEEEIQKAEPKKKKKKNNINTAAECNKRLESHKCNTNLREVSTQLLNNKRKKVAIHCYTDASLIELDLDGAKEYISGIGIFFVGGEYDHCSELITAEVVVNSNVAEMYAIKKALEIVDDRSVTIIYTDSSYCCNILKSRTSEKLYDVYKETWEMMKKRIGGAYIKHVKAHVGLPTGNYYADALAKHYTFQKKDELLLSYQENQGDDENSMASTPSVNYHDDSEDEEYNELNDPLSNINIGDVMSVDEDSLRNMIEKEKEQVDNEET